MLIACTRFNNKTMNENKVYRENNQIEGCLYGCPIKIVNYVSFGELLIVLEMNNETNKIIGIGLLKNMLSVDQYYNIYNIDHFNRYIYMGTYRLDITDIKDDDLQMIHDLEQLLFKGKCHSKRGRGISILPEKIIDIMKTKSYKKQLIKLFKQHFCIPI